MQQNFLPQNTEDAESLMRLLLNIFNFMEEKFQVTKYINYLKIRKHLSCKKLKTEIIMIGEVFYIFSWFYVLP